MEGLMIEGWMEWWQKGEKQARPGHLRRGSRHSLTHSLPDSSVRLGRRGESIREWIEAKVRVTGLALPK